MVTKPERNEEAETVVESQAQSQQYRRAARSSQPETVNRAKLSKDGDKFIRTRDANDEVADVSIADGSMEQIVVSTRGHGTVHFQTTGPNSTMSAMPMSTRSMRNTMLIAHELDPEFMHAVDQARVNQTLLRMQLEGTGQKTFFFGCLIYALDHGVQVLVTTDLIESKTERGLDFDLATARFEYLTPCDLFLVNLKHRNFANNVENAWLRHSATQLTLNGYQNNRDEIAACLWYALDYAVPVLVTAQQRTSQQTTTQPGGSKSSSHNVEEA